MTTPERETRLLKAFVALMPDHEKDFEGFFRDIENVRYCHTPIDKQQLGRCKYALRNMELRILTINNCIHSEVFKDQPLDNLVSIKNNWTAMKSRVENYLEDIVVIINATNSALSPIEATFNSSE